MNTARAGLFWGVVAVLCGGAEAADQVYVTVRNSDAVPISSDCRTLTPGQNASINLSTGAATVQISATSSAVDIGFITLTGGPANRTIRIYIGLVNAESDTAPALMGRNLLGLDASALYDSVLYGGITGNLGSSTTADQSIIRVDRLTRFDAGGTLYGDVEVQSPGGSAAAPVFVVQANTTAATNTIRLTNGDITRVRTTGACKYDPGVSACGDMTGEIVTSYGNILSVISGRRILGAFPKGIHAARGRIESIVAAGDISQSAFPNPPQGFIRANEGIGSVECRALDAIIITDSDYDSNDPSTDGSLRRLVISPASAGTITSRSRVYAKRLAWRGPGDGIDVSGTMAGIIDFVEDIGAPITLRSDMISGALIRAGTRLIEDGTKHGSISIAGTFNGTIQLPSNELKGQIIINASNTTGSWLGSVRVGTLTLAASASDALCTAPFYTRPASDLGCTNLGTPPRPFCGAIGLAPFALLGNDCTPKAGDSTDPIDLTGSFNHWSRDAVLRFYGPVRATSTVLSPVKLERKVVHGTVEIWCEIPSGFSVTCGRPDAPALFPREVRLRGEGLRRFVRGEYRITPRPEPERTLVCEGVVGNPPVVPFEYHFWMSGGAIDPAACPADLDDGSFTGTPDGGVTIDDLLYFLALFDANDPCANINADIDDGTGSGLPDGGVTIEDLLFFLQHLELGC